MKLYAAETTVTVAKSQAELRALLQKHGVERFGIVEEPGLAAIAFQHSGFTHRIVLPLRDVTYRDFATTPGGRSRTTTQRQAAAKQEAMARWRLLVLMVKANLEFAAALGQPAESAFTQYRVLENGETVQERVLGTGNVPALTWSEK